MHRSFVFSFIFFAVTKSDITCKQRVLTVYEKRKIVGTGDILNKEIDYVSLEQCAAVCTADDSCNGANYQDAIRRCQTQSTSADTIQSEIETALVKTDGKSHAAVPIRKISNWNHTCTHDRMKIIFHLI